MLPSVTVPGTLHQTLLCPTASCGQNTFIAFYVLSSTTSGSLALALSHLCLLGSSIHAAMLQYTVSVLLKHCSSMGVCGTHAHRSDAKLQPDVTLHRGRKQLGTYLADLLTTGLVSQCKETKTARKKARSVCANADLIASQGSLQEQQVFLLQAVAFLYKLTSLGENIP